jgi:cellulose biosynthesis protein BcsQ
VIFTRKSTHALRVIAFVSQKGGVDETTAGVNSAVALARRRVRLIDLDNHACALAWRRRLAFYHLGVSRA